MFNFFLDVANKSIVSSILMSMFLCTLNKVNQLIFWPMFDLKHIFNIKQNKAIITIYELRFYTDSKIYMEK